jgi:diguanylate cyclase (GGDEF)-like protein
VVDITERKQAERRLEQMAHYDALTGLPNRVLFNDRMEQALRLAAREQRPGALFVMDLDGFKAVNDRLGHEAGDLVLAEVSERLRHVLRASDTAARLGGDEFAILLPHTDEEGAMTVAAKILAALAVPLDLNGQAARIGGSVGIALFPAHGDEAAALMRHADLAMYWAKRAQRGYALYTRGGDGDSSAFDGIHREVA